MSDYYFYKQEQKIKSARKNSNVSEVDSDNHPQLKNALRRKPKTIQELIQFPQQKIQYLSAYIPEPLPIPEAIKQIDKKILAYKKVLEIAKKQKEQQERQRYLETDAELQINKQSLDFLTNPQILVKNQTTQDQFQFQNDDQNDKIENSDQFFNQTANKYVKQNKNKKQSYLESVKQREKFYEDTFEKLQMKRQNPAFFAKLKKKTPALNITTKNKIQSGNRLDLEEHQLRVINRENVPTIPEIIIPTFMKKKDNVSKNILAYLKDYSPLYNKCESQEYPKCVLNLLLGDEKDSFEKKE